uniref:Gap junction protein n=1 Tax=Ciona intestinalis TaxID=7719 RepID=F6UBJ9_CIOIN|nr:gap junction delta-2 protein-like [Ciona intestinalis]|eukprot:XP_002128756.1 gap junction delta-2 protein-like [Ciona intestinalis]
MAWHLLEKIVEHSAAHSTLLGKWWIAFMFVFRIIVVASIGDAVYSDEQDEFVCNTRQPGCKQICYNLFAPISHIRFWAFQILGTGLPSVIFIIFATHKLAVLPNKPHGKDSHNEVSTQTSPKHTTATRLRKRQLSSKHSRSSNCSKPSSSQDEAVFSDATAPPPPEYDGVCREKKLRRTKQLVLRAYILNVITRCIIEGGFLYLQYYLYNWTVPEFFECIRYPCPKIVECYISRPMEKTVFLYFMFAVSALCIVINIIEIHYLGWKRLKRALFRKQTQHVPPAQIIGAFPVEIDFPPKRDRRFRENREPPTRPSMGRIIHRRPEAAPPGYYIPDVDPPSEKYRSPANGFPPIRMRAASFTTSESDVTTDATMSSMGSVRNVMEENVRVYL